MGCPNVEILWGRAISFLVQKRKMNGVRDFGIEVLNLTPANLLNFDKSYFSHLQNKDSNGI